MLALNAELLYQNLKIKLLQEGLGLNTYLVGLADGGGQIVRRLSSEIGIPVYGIANTNFHRDDFDFKGSRVLQASKQATQFPFEVNDAHIILIDDVLDTGRSVRAALNELFDYGRPSNVDLYVLVDRNRKELPISANYASESCKIDDSQRLIMSEKNGEFQFRLVSAGKYE